MDDSILSSIKKLLGISDDDTSFDTDVIMHINSVLSVCPQIGAGGNSGFLITGKEESWSDFLGKKLETQSMVKSYVFMKVKLLFDPPTSSSVLESMKENIKELEWRLSITA